MDSNKEVLPDINNIKSQETYTLPSKGLLYKPEDNIPASITLRRMTTKEDKLRLRNTNVFQTRRDILQACIMEQGVDVNKMAVEDVNFLLFRLRTISLLDDMYKVQCTCPHCDTTFIHEFKLSDVPVNYLNKKDLSLYKVELPVSKQKIDFKAPTLANMISTNESYMDYITQFPDADRVGYLYDKSNLMYVDRVNDHKLIDVEKEEWFDSLDILDSRAISNIVRSLESLFGFDENIKAQCPNCKREVIHGLPLTRELFTPSK